MIKKCFFITLLFSLNLFLLNAYAEQTTAMPSTNEINKTNNWSYVNVISVGVGYVDLEFVSRFVNYFEYRTDGDTSQAIRDTHYNSEIDDAFYPYVKMLVGESLEKRIYAENFVEIRLALGPEGDERFDWTRFDVESAQPVTVPLDIKPGSCPNPLNVKSNGVLPVAIVGTEDLDVTQIDPTSVRLAGVAPIRSGYEDVSEPYYFLEDEPSIYDCSEYGADGMMDLTLKFKTQEIVNALGEVDDGDVVILQVTGVLDDGTELVGEDAIVIVKKGKK